MWYHKMYKKIAWNVLHVIIWIPYQKKRENTEETENPPTNTIISYVQCINTKPNDITFCNMPLSDHESW